MSGNWLHGKPTRNLDGAQTAALSCAAEIKLIGERAFHKAEARFSTSIVVGVMRRCDSVTRFPGWPELTAAFERLAACERGDEISIDAAFCGWTDEHAEEDAEAAAVTDERAEMRADLYQF
jgi:hypothetical protein